MRPLTPLDALLDASVLFSFDASGYRRHARHFRAEDIPADLQGRRIAVTGANSGIGLATTRALASRGAHVLMLCRSAERGNAALDEVVESTGNEQTELVLVDVSDFGSVRAAVQTLGDEPLHALLHNAGVLPSSRSVTADGHELTLATNVLGPFLMTWLLRAPLAQGRGRVLWVTSGGMYPTRLSLRDLQYEKGTFDGVTAYSRTKRAQVVLTEQLAQRMGPSGVTVHCMHPGWADTPAVASSIPSFHERMQGRLRTPEQGADTLVWLAVAEAPEQRNGDLWFDRRAVAAHYLPWTRASNRTRTGLWDQVCAMTGVPPQWTVS